MKPTPANDRTVLRELAARVAEIAALPAQRETIGLWKALNRLEPVRPMVMIDQVPWHEMNVDDELTLRCEDEFCRGLEHGLRRTLYSWKHMRADMVVRPFVEVPKVVVNTGFGIGTVEESAVLDPRNDVYGHAYKDQFADEGDIEKITTPQVSLDKAATDAMREKAEEALGGVLAVRMQGVLPVYAPWDIIVQWRGPEPLIIDLATRPEFMHALAARLTAAELGMLDQLEAKGLLGTDQTYIHCTGAFADELPGPGFSSDSPRARDLWTFGMSQIFSTVSPAMHEEFEQPYLAPWFARFGLAYYGCCEPLSDRIPMIRKLPHVRKVSMSPWANVEAGAEGIGRQFVFSRKPNPAFFAGSDWDLAIVKADLGETIAACRRHGCALELIQKDVSTVNYAPQRLWQWADTAMAAARNA